jgi:hypothetical protein
MNDDLVRRSVHAGRYQIIFAVFSALAAICVATSLGCSIVMLLGDHSTLTPIIIEESEPLPPDGALPALHQGALVVALILLIPTVIVWLGWLFSASRFAGKAGAEDMRYSPLMALVWHFIPVMSYIMPMLVLVELEAATRQPSDWKDLRPSRLAANTWLVSKLGMIGFVAGFGLFDKMESQGQYLGHLAVTATASLFVLTGLLLANLLIGHIYRMQVMRAQAS